MTVRHDEATGRYVYISFMGREYRTYYEEAGTGIPLVCLHTAGSDSRQYRHQLNDPEVTRRFRVLALDMPWHGKSYPPAGWQKMDEEYRLTSEFYVGFVMSFCEAVGAERPVIMGSSMGGNVCLPLAHLHGDKLRALIPLQAADYSHGWVNSYLWDGRVHGGEMAASYVMGEIAPMSPQQYRWEIWWGYATSGPGVFKGDVHFYSDDHDYREKIKEMQNTPPMYFMGGDYDAACKPEMSRSTAAKIANATFVEMINMGHFPMTENPELFKRYLYPVLDHIASGETKVSNFVWPTVEAAA